MSEPGVPIPTRLPPPSLAWWSARLSDFRLTTTETITNRLSARAIQTHRTNENKLPISWQATISILRDATASFPAHWRLLLEYPLIRLSRRLDAVLITDQAIFVVEFKTLNSTFGQSARLQAEDYAFDLRDFHAGSRHQIIVPIVVASAGTAERPQWEFPWPGVSKVYDALPKDLRPLIQNINARIPGHNLDIESWEHAPYRPVPNIIEAARSLYRHHGVEEIKTARADTSNLAATTAAILQAISDAKANRQFIILFVTGIPGAGKTLCGLNAVFSTDADATFLTGTWPMVYVLSAALAEDAKKRYGRSDRSARQHAKSKIQSITGFVRHYVLKKEDIPERIIVFDEAQRAWDARQGANSPFKLADSEAAMVLDIMARHQDYAVIVGLIGNGQEINTGEAGLAEWGRAITGRPQWHIRASALVLSKSNQPRQRLFATQPPNMSLDSNLHLGEAVRNVITSSAASWVDAVLRGHLKDAQFHAQTDLPFFITRSLPAMRTALRLRGRGQRRTGLVCSSGAKRLVADGIWPNFEHMNQAKVANWFLKSWPDVRASDALEVPVTEFACQGLELDHVGLCWGGDLIWEGKWTVRQFSGTRWQICRQRDAIDFQLNAYRVLLTRARAETIIWVPPGDPEDATRSPQDFDQTVNFLVACGARPLVAPGPPCPPKAPEGTLL